MSRTQRTPAANKTQGSTALVRARVSVVVAPIHSEPFAAFEAINHFPCPLVTTRYVVVSTNNSHLLSHIKTALGQQPLEAEDEACLVQNEPYTCKAPSPTMNNGLDSWEASSSSQSPLDRPHLTAHHDDENDLGRPDESDSALLGEDPLQGDLAPPISFKRKKKPALFDFVQPTRLITNLNGHRTSPSGGSRPVSSSYGRGAQENGHTHLENLGASPRRRGGANGNSSSKEPLDWYVEGPGRRVGYEDLTAIDWIFEYTKERTRLRVLRSNTQGLMGKLQLAFDSAQEWVILVLTGLLVGTLAAVIDITTDWLGDLKTGYCTTRDGGAFYLNKAFCCMGYDEGAQCMGWRPWAAALNISSGAGKWILEYFFFIMFSVWPLYFFL